MASKTITLSASLMLSIHLLACGWWLWKVLGMEAQEVHAFIAGQSWGSRPPSALSSTAGKLEAYSIAVYVVTQTLTTVGYGDTSADNTSERVGHVLFFIVCAFIWGDFLAAVEEIHQALGNKHRADFAAVQGTLEFLVEVDCPWALRVQILQFKRFVLEHTRDNLHKKAVIDDLPGNLQRALVKHLYAHELAHVPVFQHLESVGDDNAAHDAVR